MVSNFTSACCTSRLAAVNSQGQTHSETSSNYLCTNDGWETNQQTGSGFWTTVAYGSGTIRRMSLASGQTFAGYAIIRPLGSGGMGEVYLAQHPSLPRKDALKCWPPM
jgi:serine/threonine protein kinase